MLILINNNNTVSIADCESRSAPSAHIFHMCRSMLPVYICISSVVQASVRVLLSRRASKRAAPPSMPMSFERRSREVMRLFPRSMRAMVRAPSSRSALPARLTLRKMGSCAAAAAAADADADASLAGKNGPQSPVWLMADRFSMRANTGCREIEPSASRQILGRQRTTSLVACCA